MNILLRWWRSIFGSNESHVDRPSVKTNESFFDFLRRNDKELELSFQQSGTDKVDGGLGETGVRFSMWRSTQNPDNTIVKISFPNTEKMQIFTNKLVQAYKDRFGVDPEVTFVE